MAFGLQGFPLARLLVLQFVLGPRCLQGFYLPGVAPIEYHQGSHVELKVNKLTSVKTQLPYRFYWLPYCEPPNIHIMAENLGEILMGDSIENSLYDIQMNVNASCKYMCKRDLTEEDKQRLKRMIDDEYQVNWLVDNLPAAMRYYRRGDDTYSYMNGFPVGMKQNGRYYVHNHVRIGLQYHVDPGEFDGYRIVGFEVYPQSIKQTTKEGPDGVEASCHDAEDFTPQLDVSGTDSIIYSYDITWTPSPVAWAFRWDTYLKMHEGQIHWFSIVNSLMIVLFLSGMVAMILLRTLHRDIAKYNDMTADDTAEETGWKLVHGDVFRKPVHSKMLAVSVGSGIQLLICSAVTLVFSAFGFLSPVHRGSILQGMLLLFTFAGVVAGYFSARFYKTWKGEDWKRTTLWTAFLYPGTVFGIFFILDLFVWGTQSSGAVPFTTMFALLVLWFGISVPLVFLGAFLGYKKAPISLPVRTNQIPRQIPTQPWYISALFTSLVGGILPFGAVFTELFFIMSSIWQHQFYYLFGFLMLVIVILVVTCAEISISLTYFQLTSEDYNWWWRSFFASASSALYVFLYSCLYYYTRMQINHYVGALLYFGYMLIISYTFALITGSIGFVSTFCFVRAIYGSIKID
jgi:transmembrane 9 superfamily protein 2/4